MNRAIPEITESVSELKSRLHNATKPHEVQRLSMLYWLQSGQAKNRTQVADLLGVHRVTVGKWLTTYQIDGIEALLHRRDPPGRKSLLSDEQLDILRHRLESEAGFSRYIEIQQYIKTTFDVEMGYKAVYALVHDKWNAKLKVPRKSHQKKNEAEAEAFVTNFGSQMRNTVAKHGAHFERVRLFCQDESRCGILPVVYRRITLPGVKPIAKIDYTYEATYLYGAVEPRTGESFFLEMSHLTADCFQRFIDHLSESFSESLNLIVLDNGRFHHANSLSIPENVELVFLPAYCPELNPIERVWQDIKARLFTKVYQTLSEMQAALTEILCSYSKAAMAQLTGFPYFIKTAYEI